jgi:hypothetical protein
VALKKILVDTTTAEKCLCITDRDKLMPLASYYRIKAYPICIYIDSDDANTKLEIRSRKNIKILCKLLHYRFIQGKRINYNGIPFFSTGRFDYTIDFSYTSSSISISEWIKADGRLHNSFILTIDKNESEDLTLWLLEYYKWLKLDELAKFNPYKELIECQ